MPPPITAIVIANLSGRRTRIEPLLDGETASEPGARPGHQLLARDLACSLEVGGGELRHHVVERIHVMAHVFEESAPHIGQLDRRARIFGGRSAVIDWSPRSSRD
jgi:hypothetical protein